MTANDRREFQRLHLAKPILAQLGNRNALILDIGVGGAMVEHHGPVSPGEVVSLVFRWQGHQVEFVCEVRRTRVVRDRALLDTVTSHTGLGFIEAIGRADDYLNDMMATFVGKLLSAQRANAAGTADAPDTLVLAQLGAARRTRSAGWMSYRFADGDWHITPSRSGAQPPDGFTVAAWEDEDELQALCLTYETSDDEGRRLIRLVAELSARNVKPI